MKFDQSIIRENA